MEEAAVVVAIAPDPNDVLVAVVKAPDAQKAVALGRGRKILFKKMPCWEQGE